MSNGIDFIDDEDDFADLDDLLADLDEQVSGNGGDSAAEQIVDDGGLADVEPEPEYVFDELDEFDPIPEPTSTVPIRRFLMSGHCAWPGEDKVASHERCGGGQRANPEKIFQPCPCACHLDTTEYECGGCGKPLRSAPVIEAVTGEATFVHIDNTGRALSEYC